MTPQEQELIQNVANKLKASPNKTKDADADRFIMQEIGSQEDIVYKLTQAVLIQEMALKDLKSKSEFLEKQVAHYKTESERGALSRMMGGSNPAPVPPAPVQQPSAFGSFMQTAAGVAVGMVAGNLIADALFGDDPAPSVAEAATAEVEAVAEEATSAATEAATEIAAEQPAVEEASSFLGESSGFASEFASTDTGSFADSFTNTGFGFDDSFGAEESFSDEGDFSDYDEEI